MPSHAFVHVSQDASQHCSPGTPPYFKGLSGPSKLQKHCSFVPNPLPLSGEGTFDTWHGNLSEVVGVGADDVGVALSDGASDEGGEKLVLAEEVVLPEEVILSEADVLEDEAVLAEVVVLVNGVGEIPPVPIGAVLVLTPVPDPDPVMMPGEPEAALEGFAVGAAGFCAKSDPSTTLLNGSGLWHAPVVVEVIVVPVVLQAVAVE